MTPAAVEPEDEDGDVCAYCDAAATLIITRVLQPAWPYAVCARCYAASCAVHAQMIIRQLGATHASS
jgi:hypothetical protein